MADISMFGASSLAVTGLMVYFAGSSWLTFQCLVLHLLHNRFDGILCWLLMDNISMFGALPLAVTGLMVYFAGSSWLTFQCLVLHLMLYQVWWYILLVAHG